MCASGKLGLQDDGLLAVRQSLLGLAEIEQELAEVGASRSKIGVDRDRTAEVVEGLLSSDPELRERRAQVGVRHRVVGPQARGQLETPRRLRCGGPGPRAPVRGYCGLPGSFKPSSHAHPGSSRRRGRTAQCAIDFSESCAEDRRLRAQGDRPADQFRRQRRIGPVDDGRPPEDEGHRRCVGVAVQKRLVEPGCRRQLARLMKLDRPVNSSREMVDTMRQGSSKRPRTARFESPHATVPSVAVANAPLVRVLIFGDGAAARSGPFSWSTVGSQVAGETS